ncbi:hypothetical protein [Trueperella pyogenes]|uniref:hypothetical protein n=1 Tax=Trueperella pyogenes TaxID=1661 RepID=UPI001F0B9E81|nr:hypothetical protein [Trueperella pyogenes]
MAKHRLKVTLTDQPEPDAAVSTRKSASEAGSPASCSATHSSSPFSCRATRSAQ